MRRYLILVVVALIAASAGPAGAASPDNDAPANATIVSSFPATIEVDTSQATTGPFEEECYGSGVFVAGAAAPVRAVWYRLEVPAGTRYLKVLHHDSADVVLWDRLANAPTGDPILERRGCAYADDSYPYYLYTDVVYMSVGSSLAGDTGPFSIEIDIDLANPEDPPPVPNDVPYRATKITSLPYEVAQDTSGASFDYDRNGCPNGAYVWYSYTPPGAARIEITVTSNDRDTNASVSAYSVGADVKTLGCDSRSPGPAVVTTPVSAGVPVLIGIGDLGRLSLRVRVIPPEPTHDDRADAAPLAFGSTRAFETSGTTLEPGEPTSCGSGGSTWFALPRVHRDAKVVFTGDVSVAAVAGDSIVGCSGSGVLLLPVDSPATHLQVRASDASGTIGLRFDPAFGKQITDASPFARGCGDLTANAQPNSELEVSQTVDPHNPNHIVAAWQQDRYASGGGSQGIGAAASFDGGKTWSNSTIPGVSVCSGGVFQRATDPWTAIDADGTTYVMSLGFDPVPVNGTDPATLVNSVLINRSTDGGRTWSDPIIVAASPGVLFHDKETLTADPHTPGLLYAVWDVWPTNVAFPVFSRSENGGRSWTPPVPLPIIGGGAGEQIAVLDDGTLVDVGVRGTMQSIRSQDRGVTWSKATSFAPRGSREGPPGVRGGAYIPSVSTDGHAVFVSWSDTYATYFARSNDAGATWTVTEVGGDNNSPHRSTTAVAGTVGGHLAVITYLVGGDFKTSLALGTSTDGGVTWSEQPITDAFDLARAPYSVGRGYFLGDYFGLSASGNDVVAAFAAVPAGTDSEVSNVYSLRITP